MKFGTPSINIEVKFIEASCRIVSSLIKNCCRFDEHLGQKGSNLALNFHDPGDHFRFSDDIVAIDELTFVEVLAEFGKTVIEKYEELVSWLKFYSNLCF